MIDDQLRCDVSRLRVSIHEGTNLLLQMQCQAGRRPYIHPLLAPDGGGCLSEDSPDHHPWQHGLATGLHGVGGSDFWFDQGDGVGRIEPEPPRALGECSWHISSLWRHHHGHPLLQEEQTWSLRRDQARLLLDLHWRLSAACDLTVERCGYGGLFLRMPYRAERGSTVIDSEGRHDDACEQQPARWVAQHMRIDGRDDPASIAVLDHPGNTPHPCPWRVDRQRGINPSPCIDGDWSLSEGSTRSWRYRLVVFTGPIDVDVIELAWQAFAEEQS